MKLERTFLPQSLENYLHSENYDSGALPTDISATRLKDSPRVHRLQKKHFKDIKVDYLKRGFAKLGEAWHSHMESYAPKDWITEERFYADVHGKFISGAIDVELAAGGKIVCSGKAGGKAAPSIGARNNIKNLQAKHLLLMSDTAERAVKIYKGGQRMRSSWMGGGTSLGNALWSRYFFPCAAAAAGYLDERRTMPGKAFGELLGLLLLGRVS